MGGRTGADWLTEPEPRLGGAASRLDAALLVLRLAGVGLAGAHGVPKLRGLLAGEDRFVAVVAGLGLPAPELFAWAAALVELVGGLLVALGLLGRVAAGLAALVMAVAAFGRHRLHLHLLLATGLFEAPPGAPERWGNPELAAVYLLVFVALALVGPGRYALGGRRRRP